MPFSNRSNYKFIRRRDNKPRNGCSIDFSDQDYQHPLVGCGNLRDGIRVGDVVGVILEQTFPTSITFETGCSLLTKAKLDTLQGLTKGSVYIREEHFFQVVKTFRNKSKYDVVRVFIDSRPHACVDEMDTAGYSVIRKSCCHSFSTPLEVDVLKDCKPYELLRHLFVEERRFSALRGAVEEGDPPIDINCLDKANAAPMNDVNNQLLAAIESEFGKIRDWEEASIGRLERLTERLKDIDQLVAQFDEKLFMKGKLPYEDYRKVLVDVFESEDGEMEKDDNHDLTLLTEFFSLWSAHREVLVGLIGQERYDLFGTFEQIRENILQRYAEVNRVLNAVGQTKATITVDHNCDMPARLVSPPAITHNIKSLKYSQIYRVFDTDWRHCLQRTAVVSDWGGRKLPDTIRDDFQDGNIVRVYFTEWSRPEDEEEESCRKDGITYKRYRDQRVIYVRFLKKVTDRVFLAQVLNIYMSEYDDLVLQVHADAVTEVPIGWDGNENLDEKYKEIVDQVKEGFAMTGLSAVVKKDSTNDVNGTGDGKSITSKDNDCIALTYTISSLFRFG